MDLNQCGRSGFYLSAIGLGTLTWGRDTDGPEALEMLTHFVDAGGNFVECSASHGDGMAVDVLSEAMTSVCRHRPDVALPTPQRHTTSTRCRPTGATPSPPKLRPRPSPCDAEHSTKPPPSQQTSPGPPSHP